MKQVLGIAILILAASTLAFGQCSEADKKALEAFDRAWGEASERGDRAFLQNVFADDYMSVDPIGTVNKTQAIENAVRAAEQDRANPQSADRVSYDHYVISCTPNTATITHRTVVTSNVGGKEQTFQSRAIHVLEKRGGRWQVVSNAGHPLNDAAQLIYMQKDWGEASKGRDVAWFERNLADNATFISYRSGAVLSKREAIAAFTNSNFTYDVLDLSDVNVRIEGDTGIVTGILHLKGRDAKGQPVDHRFRFTDTVVKRDGRWLVLSSQGTAIQP